MNQIISVVLLLGAVLAVPVAADVAAGLAAYQRGDYLGARTEFEIDARGGNPEAQYMLGQMHAGGRGTLQNFVEAHKWYNLSAAGGYREAVNARDALERKMTPGQISEAQQLAASWRGSGPTRVITPGTPSRETVRAIQSELNRLGYGVGTPDGLAGRRTQEAIRNFQQANGLPVTGAPDDMLLVRLRQATRSQAAAPAPARAAASASTGTSEQGALVAELEKLIDDAERRREAQPAFINRLRSALRRHDFPWKHPVFSDDFSDGDYTRGVRWDVVSGRFNVGYRGGLTSAVQVSAGAEVQQGEQDLGKALLGVFISEMAGGSRGASPNAPAEIYTAQPIGAAFAVQLELNATAAGAQWEIGPYQGADRSGGYRLRQQDGHLHLVRASSRGSSVIEMSRSAILSDGAAHALQWTRDADGNMQVSMDGAVVLEARDRGVSGSYAGLVIVNRGGELSLRSVAVLEAR